MSRAILGLLFTAAVCMGFTSADANAGQYQFITTGDDRYVADSIKINEKFKSVELFNGEVVYRLYFARIARIVGPDGDDITVEILGDAAPPEAVVRHDLKQERQAAIKDGRPWQSPDHDRTISNRALLMLRWRGMVSMGDGVAPIGGFQVATYVPLNENLAVSLHFDQSSFWTNDDQIRSFMLGFAGFNSLSDANNRSGLVHYGLAMGIARFEEQVTGYLWGPYSFSRHGSSAIMRLQLGATPMIGPSFGIDVSSGVDVLLADGSSENSTLFFLGMGACFRL